MSSTSLTHQQLQQLQSVSRPFVPTKSAEELAKLKTTAGALPYDDEAKGVFGEKSSWKKIVDRDYVSLYKGTMNTIVLLQSNLNETIPIWVKEIHLERCPPRYAQNLQVNSTRIQRYLLKNLRTDNSTMPEGDLKKSHLFVGLYNIYICAKSVFIFMQIHNGGSLYDWCSKHMAKVDGSDHHRPPPLTSTTYHWIKQLVEVVGVLHHRGLAHRGLKLQHVMLHNDGHDVQVTGWSGAVSYWDELNKRSYLLLQQSEHRSRKNRNFPPECFIRPYDPSKVDLFSVGVIATALITGRYPFNPTCTNFSYGAQWKAFKERHLKSPVPAHSKHLLEQLFELDPVKRKNAKQILEVVKAANSLSPKSAKPTKANKTPTKENVNEKHSSKSTKKSKPKTAAVKKEEKKSNPKAAKGSGGRLSPISAKSNSTSSAYLDAKSKLTSKSPSSGAISANSGSNVSLSKTSLNSNKSFKKSGHLLSGSSSNCKQQMSGRSASNTNKKTSNFSSSLKHSMNPSSGSSGSNSMSNSSTVKTSQSFSSRRLGAPSPTTTPTTHSLYTIFDQGKDHGASGNEGGAVLENVPKEEAKKETLASFCAAPEEQEKQALPVRIDVTDLKKK